MSLSHQPFAHHPAIEALRVDLGMNLTKIERIFSAAAGLGLLTAAILQRGPAKLAWFGLGSALIGRGLTGHCELYERMGVDHRHPAIGAATAHGSGAGERA
jgi:hypothetical protein